jgi:hypothetical protein
MCGSAALGPTRVVPGWARFLLPQSEMTKAAVAAMGWPVLVISPSCLIVGLIYVRSIKYRLKNN